MNRTIRDSLERVCVIAIRLSSGVRVTEALLFVTCASSAAEAMTARIEIGPDKVPAVRCTVSDADASAAKAPMVHSPPL